MILKKVFFLCLTLALDIGVAIAQPMPPSAPTVSAVPSVPAVPGTSVKLGQFDKNKDLFLAQFDLKTDVDDVHSIAAVGTMLRDKRFSGMNYYGVHGSYGKQGGEFVPAPSLMNAVFGTAWSDAHDDKNTAVRTVTNKILKVLASGGDIWIMEAGQSDFSADVVRQVKSKSAYNTNQRIHIVQHSDWNEKQTTNVDLLYVKNNTDYQRIPDGNSTGNGTPNFHNKNGDNWKRASSAPEVGSFWRSARRIANQYNGKAGRYDNPAVRDGGMDFSDAVEFCHIVQINPANLKAFFDEFL